MSKSPKQKTAPPRSTRAKWRRRFAIAVGLYAVFGFLILPVIIKWQLQKRLPTFTHRAARVDAVRVNPFVLSLGLRGLALTEADGSTFVAFSNFYANFGAWASLANRAWTFQEIQLGSPYGSVVVFTNGQFNFANLLTNAPATNTPATPPRPPPSIFVASLVITNGTFTVADFYRATPFQTTFTPIDVRLTNFTMRPRTGSPYSFTASTGEGEYFNWAGSVGAVPPASSGRFELGGIDLKKYGTYAREFTQLDVRDGKVKVGGTYAFTLETNGVQLAITNASVVLTNLAVFAPDTANTNALIQIPSVTVRGVEADWQQRRMKVRSIETTGGSIVARRFRDGAVELWQLIAPPTNRAPSLLNLPATTNAPVVTQIIPAAPWSVLVENIAVRDYAARVEDQFPPTPASLVADHISLDVTGLSLASNAPVSVQLSTRVNQTGGVKLSARGTILPVSLDTELDVNALELRPFQPYVEQQHVKLAFTSGRVSTKGRASVALGASNALAATFSGDLVLDDVAVVDQIALQDFVKWKQVAVRGIDFTLAPMSLKVRELAADSVAATAVLNTNGQLTLVAALPPATTNAAPGAPKPASEKSADLLPFPVQLGLLTVTNNSLHFADLSIQPNARFSVQQFSGTVRGLSSALNTAAEVDIRGRMNESAPFSVAGKINPLVRDVLIDLVVTNQNTELTAFTPYMEKFGGHELRKGKFTVGLRVNLNQRALDSETVVFIDQFTLGPRNTSPAATKLPVKLGVALLKDRNGRIELSVPVQGRLDDPKFRVWPVVWHVMENLLLKAAASPFALLGSVVGGGGEELSHLEFAPGQAEISETEAAKIEKLGQAFYERPALNLEIMGSADEPLDRAALAWLKLERELKTTRLAELAGKDNAPATAEAVKLEPRDYERLLKTEYKKVFQRALPLPEVVTNSAGVVITNVIASAPRATTGKGAESLTIRSTPKPAAKDTNAVTAPLALTRPALLPPVNDELLARMETELAAQKKVTDDDVRELKQARAQSVHRALLKTEKVTAERLFILAPLPADAASKGQARVNLSLN